MALTASGSAPATVLDQINQREARIKALETELLEVQLRPPNPAGHQATEESGQRQAGTV